MDKQALKEWCDARRVTLAESSMRLKETTSVYIVAEIPESTQEQIAFAGDLLALAGFCETSIDMLWVSTWGLWSDWNRELGETIITRLRASPGEIPISLETFSAHTSSINERKISVAMLLQLMMFRWDGWLAPDDAAYIVQCSHDGLIWITCRNSDTQSRILDDLAVWRPEIRPMIGAAIS